MNTIETGYPRNDPEALIRAIDLANLQEEQQQTPYITRHNMLYQGIGYGVTNYYPTKFRTYKNEKGKDVYYPHLLMVHGVASNSSYFEPLATDMARLGIASSAVDLPRRAFAGFKPEQMLNWQVSAVANAYEHIKETERHDSEITMVGHSRGAIIATKATRQLYDNEFYRPAGLILLAPAGFEKIADGKMRKAAMQLGPLAINSFKNGLIQPNRLKQNFGMMFTVVASNPLQSYSEINQAINIDITHLFEEMSELKIFVPFAEDDEFIKYDKLYKTALKNSNLSVVTVESSHLLDNPKYEDLISLADPRILSGQILSFSQAINKNYSIKIVHPETGSVGRLSATNIQKAMADIMLANSNN